MTDTCQTCWGSRWTYVWARDGGPEDTEMKRVVCPDCGGTGKPPEPKDCPACGASNASVCAHHENERPEGCINTDEVIGGRIARIAKPTEGGERYVVKERPRDRGDCDYCVFDNLLMLPVLRGIDIKSAAQISANTFNALEAQHTQSLLAAERERVAAAVEFAVETLKAAVERFEPYRRQSPHLHDDLTLAYVRLEAATLTQQEATNE